MGKEKHTLCWLCKNAGGGCSWSKTFKPVKGWVAEPTILHISKDQTLNSFNVESCPQFKKLDYKSKREKVAEKAAELGISQRTLYRRLNVFKNDKDKEDEKCQN